jgi:hypothetical protein
MPVKLRRGELPSRLFTGLEVPRAGGDGLFILGPFGPAALPVCDGTGGVSTAEPDCARTIPIKQTAAKIEITAASVKRCIGSSPSVLLSTCCDEDA